MECIVCGSNQIVECSSSPFKSYSAFCVVCRLYGGNYDCDGKRFEDFYLIKHDGEKTYVIWSNQKIDGFEYFDFAQVEGKFNIDEIDTLPPEQFSFSTHSRKLFPEDAKDTLDRLIKLQSFQ